ncbi:MAG: DUF3887 domain-containing protein [Clostridia bacterium]|nr:DUF3887 domain-containing protein [Clostridia bacterium]
MKKATFLLLSVALVLSLTACASNIKLADGFSEEEVIAHAKSCVQNTNALDFDAVVAGLREDLQTQVTAESLENNWWHLLKEAGKFDDYKTIVVYGAKDKTTQEDYAVCVLVCKYENKNRTFTLSMDKNYELIGLYMK